MTKNSTLQVESQLTEVSLGVVQRAIGAAIAVLVVHRGYGRSEELMLEANTMVLKAARELYGWGSLPFHKGRNFTAEGWMAWAKACSAGKRSNAEWPDYAAMKPVVAKLVEGITKV